ncbi:uncharacterized protein LOC126056928 isoform X2 [Helicoverpa armigera]|uniref:uncharacterized protein LOC126056928 isoform X2 n=1 Tax=Helicoverpa armigera TaxID=29058 RepID=UPI003082EBE6
MLFYSVFCGLLLGVLAIKSARRISLNSEPTHKPEVIFADVIKNISRVNNVLQELISNYEQLQKIYKSQETFDRSAETSSGGEVPYKVNNIRQGVIKKNLSHKKSRFFQNELGEKTTTTPFKHETEMILSDIDVDKSREFKINADGIQRPPSKKQIEPVMENAPSVIPVSGYEEETTASTTKTSLSLIPIPIDSSSSFEQVPEQMAPSRSTKPKRPTRSKIPRILASNLETTPKTTMPTLPPMMKSNNVQKQVLPEIIFVDTHKKVKNKAERKKPHIMPEMALDPVKAPKTRYNVKSARDNTDDSLKQSKKIVQSPQTTLKEESDSEEAAGSKQNEKVEEKDVEIQPQDEKPAPPNPPNLRTILKVNRTGVKDRASDNTSMELSDDEDDEALTKDMFKTSVLRQAYGDACLKLVVRKCYKACKITLVSSCRAQGCHRDVKTAFKKHYKKGCDKQFEDSPKLSLRRILKTEGVHADLAKAGYLSVVCQRHMETGTSTSTTKGVLREGPTTPAQPVDQELNILRDRYEKACSKISEDKCKSACHYAQNATCVKFECTKRLKKNFRRNCGTQCRLAYASSGSKDSDSDSDGDSDDSGSESSDDSGSESESD